MTKGRSKNIDEQEIHATRSEMPQEDTFDLYRGFGKVEIQALAEHSTFIRVSKTDAPLSEVRINGRFVYTTRHKQLKAGRAKTEAYR